MTTHHAEKRRVDWLCQTRATALPLPPPRQEDVWPVNIYANSVGAIRMDEDKTQELKKVMNTGRFSYGKRFKQHLSIFTKRLLGWLLVFLVGYYNLSFSWLLAPLLLFVLHDMESEEKKLKRDIIRSIANGEADILQEVQRLSNLPSWVSSCSGRTTCCNNGICLSRKTLIPKLSTSFFLLLRL